MNKTLFIALLALIAISSVQCVIEEEDDVMVLTDANFDEAINGNEFILVEFYAPWCGHCKKLTPEFAGAAKTLKAAEKAVPLGKVDATENKECSGKFEIKGFPSLKFFNNGTAVDYNGGRTNAEIVSWVTKRTGDVSTLLVDQAGVDAFLESSNLAVLFFPSETSGDKWEAYKSTCMGFDKIAFAHVTDSALAVGNQSQVGGLAFFKNFDEKRNDFEGEFTAEALKAFINAKKLATVMEFDDTAIEVVFQQQQPTLFIFHNENEESQTARAQFDLLAQELKGGEVKFAFATPENQHWQRLGDYIGINTAQVPALMLVKAGQDIQKYRFSQAITLENLRAFVDDFTNNKLSLDIKSEDVPESNDAPVKVIVGKNFEEIVLNSGKDVLVEFYAPWCGHCKKLIPEWQAAAELLVANPNIVMAMCDSTANEIPNVTVKGYPTLIFFPGTTSGKQVEFKGDRTGAGIVAWLKENTTQPWVEVATDAQEEVVQEEEINEPVKDDL